MASPHPFGGLRAGSNLLPPGEKGLSTHPLRDRRIERTKRRKLLEMVAIAI